MSSKKDLKELMAIAKRQGWAIVINKHIKWQAPNGNIYFSSQSPSDYRALRNIKRDLSLRGLKINGQ
jgi:hypothetical protein